MSIEVDAVARHLVYEPREAWYRADPVRGERTYVVRSGVLPSAADEVLARGRVGMAGIVALYRHDWLWEVAENEYMLRRFMLDTDGAVRLDAVVRGATPCEAVRAARPADASPSTKYDAAGVFGLARVAIQCARLLLPRMELRSLLASPLGLPRCGACTSTMPADDCGQLVGHKRLCRGCVGVYVRQEAAVRTAAAALEALQKEKALADERAARLAADRAAAAVARAAAAPMAAAAPELTLLLDVRSLGHALAGRLTCDSDGCRGPVAYTTATVEERRGVAKLAFTCTTHAAAHGGTTFVTALVGKSAKSAMAQRLALGLCMAGSTMRQLETALAPLGCILPVGRQLYYNTAQPALSKAVAAVRNAVLTANQATVAAAGGNVVVGVDGTWSHRREAAEASVLAVDAASGRLLEVQHLLLRPRQVPAHLRDDTRVALPRCAPKALEGVGAELVARRMATAGVPVTAVVKDDDSTALAAVRTAYAAVEERLDRNHYLKSFIKVVKAAAGSLPGLRGRAEHLRAHLQRMLRAATAHQGLLDPMLDAWVAHLGCDHSSCPTAASCAPGQPLEFTGFHCVEACSCPDCTPRRATLAAEKAAHPRRARYAPLDEEV
jgi:hypothetical protein